MNRKTPQKSKRRSGGIMSPLPDSPQFSPVTVTVGRSPTQGNLTGTPRKVKDCCADWHSSINKWKMLNTRGFQSVQNIGNSRLQTILKSEAEDGGSKNIYPAVDSDTSDQLECWCKQLQEIYTSLERIVEKMQKLTEAFRGVVELERHRNEGLEEEPLFISWTTDIFYKTSDQLLQMYKEELPVKELIVQNIAHGSSRDMIMFYTATWKHEPYIDWPTATLMLESMLTETGHR
ncbi:hypothetical protein NP493_734g02023 [Ridgeia piscesae]|uniref:Cyclin-dependent kinase 2-interacting protein n=1 Tax=Ridgeia piscesae TaxID=27915 RepID=A0AAD9KQG8_RIDPI|nr:hypothetical protein NP493_734g02023 [Ridgeia piscesae]